MMISIIVPVYNGERYLAECIDSVLGQTFADWELIIVDDGSTDGSGAIADRYCLHDDRIRVMHRVNGGMSVARNTGIESVSGEYVYFLDCDDILHPEALALLFDAIETNKADMAIAGAVLGSSYSPKRLGKVCFRNMNPIEVVKDSLYQRGILHAPWGKIYKKTILDKVRFTKGLCYEDLDFFYRYSLLCDKIAVSYEKLYFYRQHPSSIMHTWTGQRLDVLDVVDDIEAYMAESQPELLPAARDRKLSANFNIFLLADKYGQPDVADRCWNVIKLYRYGSLKDKNVRLKNKVGIILSYLGRKAFALLGSLA